MTILCLPLPHRRDVSWCRIPGKPMAARGEVANCRACAREVAWKLKRVTVDLRKGKSEMTATIFPRELGVKLTCNKRGATEQTAMCGKGRNRDWFKSKGWGRGSDPGLPARDAMPARETKFMLRGVEVTRKLPATAGTPGRPSTFSHDLCPACLTLDRESAKERKVARDKQIAARDLKRKERDAVVRHTKAQAEADTR